MTLELLKLIVQPVVLERDQDGRVAGERLGEPTPIYTFADLTKFHQALEDQIAAANVAGELELEPDHQEDTDARDNGRVDDDRARARTRGARARSDA